MEAEIAALIGAGGTALVELMVTEAWDNAKRIALRIFKKSDADDATDIAADLEASQESLRSATSDRDFPERRAELEAEWTGRIRRAVGQNPEAVNAVRDLLELRSSTTLPSTAANVTNSAVSRENSRVYQQGTGTQYNY